MLQVDENLSTGETLTDDDIIALVSDKDKDDSATDEDDSDLEIVEVAETTSTVSPITLSEAKQNSQKLLTYFEQLSEYDNSEGINCTTQIINILDKRSQPVKQTKVTEFFK